MPAFSPMHTHPGAVASCHLFLKSLCIDIDALFIGIAVSNLWSLILSNALCLCLLSIQEWPISGGNWGQGTQSYPEIIITG